MPPESIQETRKAVREGIDTYLSQRGLSISTDSDNPQANHIEIGRGLTEFYIRDIAYYIDGVIDKDAIDNGLECDGSNDLGIDFIYEKPDNNEFWIYQSKYKGKQSSLTKDEIAGFFNIHKRIMDRNSFAGANNTIKELLMGFNKKSSVTFVLLTNDQVSDKNKMEFSRLKNEMKKQSCAENYDWELVGLSEIKSNIKQAMSVDSKPPSIDIPITHFGNEVGVIDLSKEIKTHGKSYQTIVTVIRGTTLFNLCKEHRNSLFNYNIRGFLGSVKKNKEIMKTLHESPEFFYLFNNGMSAICSNLQIVKNGGALAKCQDFQIINGAQTACSIREFGKNYGEDNLKKVWVLLRITQTETIKREKGLNKKIITANNTQNIIKDSDFRSNDPVQLSLEKQIKVKSFQYREESRLKKLVYCPKRVYRERKKNEIVVTMEELAKALFAFKKDDPAKLNSQTKFLFDETEDGSYWEIFGENGEAATFVMKHAIKEFAAIMILNYFLDTKLKKGIKENDKDSILGMVYRCRRHFLWGFGYIIREFHSESQRKKIYDKIVDHEKGNAFSSDGFVNLWYGKVHRCIERTLERDSENDGDGKVLNFKLWLRDSKKINALKRELGYMQEDGGFKL